MSELSKKTSFGGLVGAISGNGLATRPSRKACEELPDQDQDAFMSGQATLPSRTPGSGGFASAISGGGLSTRPSRKAYDGLTEAERVLGKTSVVPSCFAAKREDAEVSSGAAGVAEIALVGAKLTGVELLKAWLAVILFTLLNILVNMGNLLLTYLNEKMVEDIGMTDAQYGMIEGYAYYLVLGLSMLLWGFIADKYKLNRVYLIVIGTILTAASLIVQAVAKNFTMLLAGVVVNAIASSVVQNITFAVLSDILPPEQLGLGGGIFGSSAYVGELLCGNVAYVTLQHKGSWRWPMAMCGVAVFAVSVAVVLIIKEPPVGKFISQRKDETRTSPHEFNLKATWLYLVSMSSFWMLVLAAGFRMMSATIVGAYMPVYAQLANADQSTVFAAESSVVGVCGFLAAVCAGVLCERLFARIPAISLYTTSIGSIAASVFMALAVYSAAMVQASDARYAMFLAFLALSILCSEGWIGPVTCLVALILPPEIKSFGVSLWSAVATVLIMPAGNVIFSIYLTSGGWANGSPEWLSAARIFLAASIIGGYYVSAAFFLTSARFMGQDRAMLETVLQTGTLDSVAPSWKKKLSVYIGVAAIVLVTVVLILLSFLFSYDLKLVHKG